MTNKISIALLSLVTSVIAHGGVHSYDIDGVRYEGYKWWRIGGGAPSIQRKWGMEPVEHVDDPRIRCYDNQQTSPSLHAPIAAGGIITANWHNLTETFMMDNGSYPDTYFCTPDNLGTCLYDSWFHVQGPLMAFLAACDGPCDNFDGSGNAWFKIAEAGLNPGRRYIDVYVDPPFDPPAFYQELLWRNKIGWNFTIPASLKPGNYLLRTDVFAMHSSRPQFYPACAQITVMGDGTAEPPADYLVSFPGAYNDSDPGIEAMHTFFADKQDPGYYNYIVPGGKVWNGESADRKTAT